MSNRMRIKNKPKFYMAIIIIALIFSNLILIKTNRDLKQDFYVSLLEKKVEIARLEVAADEGVKKIELIQSELVEIKSLSKYELYDIPLTVEQQIFIQTECEKIGFEYRMYLAMLRQESNYKNIVGHVNSNGTRDYGIAQLNERYNDWRAELAGLKEYDVMNIEDNIKMSLSQLQWINETYDTEGIDSVYVYNVGHPKDDLRSKHTEKVLKYYDELDELRVDS